MQGRTPLHGHFQLRKNIKAAKKAGKSLRNYLKDKEKNNGKNMDISGTKGRIS